MPSATRQKRQQTRSGRRFSFTGHPAANLLIAFVNNGLPFPVDPQRDLDPGKDSLARMLQEAARRSIARLIRAEKEWLSPRKVARMSAETDATLDGIQSELTRLEAEWPTESDPKATPAERARLQAIAIGLERVHHFMRAYRFTSAPFLDAVLNRGLCAEDRATLAIVSGIEDLCASPDVLDLAECPCGRFFVRRRGQARYCPAVTCKARRERKTAYATAERRRTAQEDAAFREARRAVLTSHRSKPRRPPTTMI